jgi:hypothetical protein
MKIPSPSKGSHLRQKFWVRSLRFVVADAFASYSPRRKFSVGLQISPGFRSKPADNRGRIRAVAGSSLLRALVGENSRVRVKIVGNVQNPSHICSGDGSGVVGPYHQAVIKFVPAPRRSNVLQTSALVDRRGPKSKPKNARFGLGQIADRTPQADGQCSAPVSSLGKYVKVRLKYAFIYIKFEMQISVNLKF